MFKSMQIYFFCFLDSILHFFWSHQSNYKTFDELVGEIKFTPRILKSGQNTTKQILRHLSWILDININIIGFKRTRDQSHQYNEVPNESYFFYYIFQNTFTKLNQIPKLPLNINILYFEDKYYNLIAPNIDIKPFLIYNRSPQDYISKDDILKIINGEKPSKNFSYNINLYTSYNFISNISTTASIHIIGKYSSNNGDRKKTIHLFITPSLHGQNFECTVLSSLSKDLIFNKINKYSNGHLLEGFKSVLNKANKPQEPLNQEFCICNHLHTKRIFISKKPGTKQLGN